VDDSMALLAAVDVERRHEAAATAREFVLG
jgi:hypothetical protein